jgi:hypothetical protein
MNGTSEVSLSFRVRLKTPRFVILSERQRAKNLAFLEQHMRFFGAARLRMTPLEEFEDSHLDSGMSH